MKVYSLPLKQNSNLEAMAVWGIYFYEFGKLIFEFLLKSQCPRKATNILNQKREKQVPKHIIKLNKTNAA